MKRWRSISRALHRDVGYGVSALILAYSISGIAVNHFDDWNPNYAFDERQVNVGPVAETTPEGLEKVVVERLKADADLALDPKEIKGRFYESPESFRIYLEGGGEVRIDPKTGIGVLKRQTTRAFLYEVNSLHLNNLKGVWTWVADLFALLLIFLVITGFLMLKGPKGLMGRGKYFVAVGLIIPVVFIIYAYNGA
jgi:hypothetical protein